LPFGRVRQQLFEDLDQLGEARAGTRRHEAHRHEMTFAQRLLERRVQLVGGNLALFQIQRHQFLVDFDDLVDQRAMGVGDRRKSDSPEGLKKAVDDALAVARRKIDRQALLAERRLDAGKQQREGRHSRHRSC
jgi:hypothetical protein